MRKTTKPAVICKQCGSTLKGEGYDLFCDNCQQKIQSNEGYLEVSTFWKSSRYDIPATHNEFCSGKSVREWLQQYPKSHNLEMVEFITLPYIHNFKELKELLDFKEENDE